MDMGEVDVMVEEMKLVIEMLNGLGDGAKEAFYVWLGLGVLKSGFGYLFAGVMISKVIQLFKSLIAHIPSTGDAKVGDD